MLGGPASGHRAADGERWPDTVHFSKSAIGPARYNRAQVVVSRAFLRLEQRGLAFRGQLGRHGGIVLTHKGRTLAESLSANPAPNIRKVSRYEGEAGGFDTGRSA